MAKAIIEAQFDPAQLTLRELMDLYVEKRGIKQLSGLSDDTFKSFMDRPAIEFFESAREENNPLQTYLDKKAKAGVSTGSLTSTYSAVKNLEDNVIHQLKRLKRMGDYADDTNGFPKLTDTVVQPKKGAPRSKKLRINPSKFGELKVKLLQHAKDNPKDVPIVRALITQMYTGFRPKEIMGMPMKGTIRPADDGSAAKGLFLPADLAKMDEAMAIPLTPHVEGTFNAAIKSNSARFKDKSIPDLMFLTDDGKKIPEGAMSRVLKSIKVPGILEDARTGEKIDYLTAAYDLRRGHATYVNMLGFPPQVGAEMKARAIKEVGAGEEPKYIAKPFGFYTPQQLSPHIALHNAIDNQTAAAMGIEGAKTDRNILLDPNQDAIETFKNVNRSQDFPTIKTVEMRNVAPVDLPSNITLPEVTANEPVDTQLRNSRFKGALNKIDWNNLKGGAAVATTGVLSMIDPVDAAVTGVTRSNILGMAASETLAPSDTGLDLPEKIAEAFGMSKQDAYSLSEVELNKLDRLHTQRMQRSQEAQSEVASAASISPVTASEEKRFEGMRSQARNLRDLQDSLASSKPRLDTGEQPTITP